MNPHNADWVAVRYEDAWPSHPDEDLPPDGALIEMWRDNGMEFIRSIGRVVRHEVDGRPTATIADSESLVLAPPVDLPESHGRAGVVWRLA